MPRTNCFVRLPSLPLARWWHLALLLGLSQARRVRQISSSSLLSLRQSSPDGFVLVEVHVVFVHGKGQNRLAAWQVLYNLLVVYHDAPVALSPAVLQDHPWSRSLVLPIVLCPVELLADLREVRENLPYLALQKRRHLPRATELVVI